MKCDNADKFSNLKYKQYILKKTGIFPKTISTDNMIRFMEMLSIKNDVLGKDLMMKIAGSLFL